MISFIFAPEMVFPFGAPEFASVEFLPLPSVNIAVPFSFQAQALTSSICLSANFAVLFVSFTNVLGEGSNAIAFFISGNFEKASSRVSPV